MSVFSFCCINIGSRPPFGERNVRMSKYGYVYVVKHKPELNFEVLRTFQNKLKSQMNNKLLKIFKSDRVVEYLK